MTAHQLNLVKVVHPPVVDNIPNTLIHLSTIHGLGLFSTELIQPGMLLATLDGQIVDYHFYYKTKEFLKLSKFQDEYLFTEWNSIPGNKLLARMFRTKYSYINHSRTPNCQLMGYPPQLWSIEPISEMQELTLDYRLEPLPDDYLDTHGKTYL